MSSLVESIPMCIPPPDSPESASRRSLQSHGSAQPPMSHNIDSDVYNTRKSYASDVKMLSKSSELLGRDSCSTLNSSGTQIHHRHISQYNPSSRGHSSSLSSAGASLQSTCGGFSDDTEKSKKARNSHLSELLVGPKGIPVRMSAAAKGYEQGQYVTVLGEDTVVSKGMDVTTKKHGFWKRMFA